MLDDDVVAVSPATAYRVLRAAGRLDRHRPKPSKKGTGFVQPLGPHVHWHIDIAVITIARVYYYLCSVLDGYSRYVVHWEFLDRMTEADVELILQRALEVHPGAHPRVISDNGSQFIAGDFRRFIDLAGLTHVRTSVNYPPGQRQDRAVSPDPRQEHHPRRHARRPILGACVGALGLPLACDRGRPRSRSRVRGVCRAG
nr:DDE-type integrase/transposase/recombinase [Nannocystis sp. RBIL2]